jgi:hypothetical protein
MRAVLRLERILKGLPSSVERIPDAFASSGETLRNLLKRELAVSL